ncbi:MAG: type II toxin-antitoxin system RelE/ParE family toxin [Desulfobacterales bacterium]|uniref:Type II toxin-antitoxin system RelE/ParE family toxin n=1 Tax=Candidatus Desulfatibia vada TaxID=2841696 RepID=A0A8J6TPF4_9BACT|nr:type II toxin-antitoxin system RelE/ParE family toxin [Candidatus Desulfatibia vada]MBL6971663.1 type II toxin-antitoxin system RelE/ParE family toxin [Desulfobacterales bacterium]
MNFEFKKSFAKDLRKKSKETKLLSRVQEIIQEVDNVGSLHEIKNLKKLKVEGNYYRIRFGDYRIGLVIEDDIIYFVRLLHRSEIYRYFP